MILRKLHTTNTSGCPAHSPNIGLRESHGFSSIREKHHVIRSICDRHSNEMIRILQVHGNDAHLSRPREMRERRFFHNPLGGRHEYEMCVIEFFNRKDCCYFLPLRELQHIDDRFPSTRPASLWHLIDLQPIHAP